jgi:hypothetical protein
MKFPQVLRQLLILGLAGSTAAAAPSPKEPRDWRWVQGAVFVPTSAVNEAQQWDEYDPAINDRELHYASIYGFNVVRVYLHYYVYLKKGPVLLEHIEDFLTRADQYGIKTEFVFFDDCWNQPPEELLSPDYKYPAPLPGVHNSQWLVSPGEAVRKNYEQHWARLKSYVQDIVNAHKDDPRIAFWETCNEPSNTPETLRLLTDAYDWIKETGSPIPVTATGGVTDSGVCFPGERYSDFKTWHVYKNQYAISGDKFALNTECMEREDQSVPGIISHFKGKTGYIMWELGIGRDNCRFSWEENREKPRRDEAVTPFHGIIYPDGHPWSVDDVKALLGAQKFSETPFFTVEYFIDPDFKSPAKTSVVPFIDFDLGDEVGTGSPDATVRVPKDNFSIAYTGAIVAPAAGSYTINVDCDHWASVLIDGKTVLEKRTPGRGEMSGTISLDAGREYPIVIRYVHASGDASLHLSWSGPNLSRRVLEPASFAPKDL